MSVWGCAVDALPAHRAQRMSLTRDGGAMSVDDVPTAWADDASFRAWFTARLAGCPFSAFRWETPGLSTRTLAQPFECVLVDDPHLQRRADPNTFARHFAGPHRDADVRAVANLTGTSTLIVPRALADTAHYAHLAAFLRGAPATQIDTLWRCVGATLRSQCDARTRWLSTAGAGVAWLHVRIDPTPKYYAYRPYAQGGEAKSETRMS